MKNWKTTTAAVLTAVVAWANAAIAVLDGVAQTQPDYTLAVTLTIAAAGLLFAKDNNK